MGEVEVEEGGGVRLVAVSGEEGRGGRGENVVERS